MAVMRIRIQIRFSLVEPDPLHETVPEIYINKKKLQKKYHIFLFFFFWLIHMNNKLLNNNNKIA